MDYNFTLPRGSSYSSEEEDRPQALSRNQRRLQLRNSKVKPSCLSLGSYTADEIVIPKIRGRSSSNSSSKSSKSFSSFDEDFATANTSIELSGLHYETYPARKITSSGNDSLWASDEKRRKLTGDRSRESSLFSEASTLVSEAALREMEVTGFGDLRELEGHSLVGPRFYDSGSGSDRPFSSYGQGGRNVSIETPTGYSNGSPTRKASRSRRVSSNTNRNGLVTPSPRKQLGRRNTENSRNSVYSHPDDTAKYVEHLEVQLAEYIAKYNELASPESTASNVARLKKLTAENRALKNEIEEWETGFEDRVKEEARARIIQNEMEARARVKVVEDRAERAEQSNKELNTQINRAYKEIQDIVEAAQLDREELEAKVQYWHGQATAYKDIAERNANHSSNTSPNNSRPNSRGQMAPGRSSLYSPLSASFMAAFGSHSNSSSRRESVCSDMSDGIERFHMRRRSQASSAASGEVEPQARKPALPVGTILASVTASSRSAKRSSLSPVGSDMGSERSFSGSDTLQTRRMRKFSEGTAAPMPLILPSSLGLVSSPPSPSPSTFQVAVQVPTPCNSPPLENHGFFGGSSDTGSRPPSSASILGANGFYGAGLAANDSTTSIDSTNSAHSLASVPRSVKGYIGANSLFAELEGFGGDDDESLARDDTSVYSGNSRITSYSSGFPFANGLSDTGARVVRRASSVFTTSGSLSAAARAIVGSNIVGSILVPSQQGSLFTALTSSSTDTIHFVASAMTRNRLGKAIVAVGHGLRSPGLALYNAKRKAADILGRPLVEESGVDRITRRRRRSLARGREGKRWDEVPCQDCVERGRKKGGRGVKRSASAPTTARLTSVRLYSGTPERSCSRESGQRGEAVERVGKSNKRRKSVITKESQTVEYPIPRQRQVHAGDNVWTWFRFVVAVFVALGVAGSQGMKGEGADEGRPSENVVLEEYDGNYVFSDTDEPSHTDEDDTVEVKVERWRRQGLMV